MVHRDAVPRGRDAATAAPLILACGAIFLLQGFRAGTPDERRRRFAIAAAHAAALGYLALLYLRFPRNEAAAEFPSDPLATAGPIARSLLTEMFTERAPASPVLLGALVFFAVVGAAAFAMRRVAGGATMLLMAGGVGGATVAALALGDHWLSPRYLLPILPPVLATVAAGVGIAADGLARLIPGRRRPEIAGVVGAGAAIALIIPLALLAREDSLWKADWRSIVGSLVAHARPGDEVVAADGWVAHSLRHHLGEAGSSMRVIDAGGDAAKAAPVVGRRPRVWLMSGGYAGNDDAAEWMRCRFLLVDSEPVENVRLYYAPGLGDYLENRTTPPEIDRLERSFYGAAGGRFEMGRLDDPFLDSGWYGHDVVAGVEVRWAGERAALLVPRWPRGSSLRIRASSIATPMEMKVRIDGDPVGSITFREGEHAYELPLPDARSSLHHVELSFSRTLRPSDLGESADHRELSVLFHWIELAPPGSGVATAGFAFRPDRSAPRAEEPRIVPRELPPMPEERLRLLLLEAGYDPEREMPRLREGRADLVDLIADSLRADCQSDEEFIRRLYLLVLDVLPDEEGTKGYMARMRRGATREQIVDWTLESWAKRGG